MASKQITDPTKWSGAWGTGVGRSGEKWSTRLIEAGPSIFSKAAAAVGHWQSQVASPMAAAAFVKGLNAVNQSQFTATVNGAGKSKYTTSGTTKQAKYAAFASIFGPKLQTIVSNLPPRAARGDPANRTRLNQLLDAVQATRGLN